MFVLIYVEIFYEIIYDCEVFNDELIEYDWFYFYYEDFMGQYGCFYCIYYNQIWYWENQCKMEELVYDLGFIKVFQFKLVVVKCIKEYVVGGGFMFVMCFVIDIYDIVLVVEGVDICVEMYDGDFVDFNV